MKERHNTNVWIDLPPRRITTMDRGSVLDISGSSANPLIEDFEGNWSRLVGKRIKLHMDRKHGKRFQR